MKFLVFSLLSLICLCACGVVENEPEESNQPRIIEIDSEKIIQALNGYVPVPATQMAALVIEDITVTRLDQVSVQLRNHLEKAELAVTAAVTVDGVEDESVEKVIMVSPGSAVTEFFTLPVAMRDEHEIKVTVKLESPDELREWEEDMDFVTPARTASIDVAAYKKASFIDFDVVIDGNLESWSELPASFIGGDQFNARIRTGWDEEFFYLAVKVKDSDHFNSRTGSDIWNGDCVQFAVDPRKDGVHPFNLVVALASDLVQSYQYMGPDTGLWDQSEYQVVRDDDSMMTYYEVRIPFETLKIEPVAGTVIGFSVVVFEDDDGGGYDYWIEFGSGVAGGWNPGLFEDMVLWQ